MEYGVFSFWGLLGYAKRFCGAASLLDSWPGKFSRQRNVVIWNMIPHCLMWGTWRERNAQTFEGHEGSIQDLELYIFQTLFEWTNATGVFTFNYLFGFDQ